MEATDELTNGGTLTDAPKARAFSASELVQCGACARANPPTRASCLYCGSALEITELNAFSPAPIQEAETSSDSAFHVVACGPAHIEETTLAQMAALLDRKPAELESLLAHPAGAAVLTVKSEKEARIAAERLDDYGVRAYCISDKQLAHETAPTSVSALEIRHDAVSGSGRSNQTVAASWDEITLIVIGRLYFETREIDQKRSRAQQVIDERELLSDEAVLDIYTRGDVHGWRIRAGNFDFSCLGDNKQLTAFANFVALTALLREHATAAAFDDRYVRLRGALNGVWPAESTAHAKERRRTTFGDFDTSVTSIDNELQFTRYSRLLRHLHASNSEDHVA